MSKEQFNYDYVPAHIREGLQRYLEQGVLPGRFLQALITRASWTEVLDAADHMNQAHLVNWRRFFYSEAPAQAWGSTAAMQAWHERGGLQGWPDQADLLREDEAGAEMELADELAGEAERDEDDALERGPELLGDPADVLTNKGMPTPFDQLAAGLPCLCAGYGDSCVCGDGEKALRQYWDKRPGLPPMTHVQRQWCVEELRQVEGMDSEAAELLGLMGAGPEADARFAELVLTAWLEYCRDAGLI